MTHASIRAMLIVVVLGLAGPLASGDVMTFNGLGMTETVRIDADGTLADGLTVPAGEFQVAYQGQDYLGYCVDLNAYAGSGPVVELPYSSLNHGDMVAYLYETYAHGVSTPVQAAGLQVAIWELLAEPAAPYTVGSGHFSISRNADVSARADEMLTNLPGSYAPRTQIKVLQSDAKQDVLIGTGVPIPEPAVLALLGIGGAAVLARRRARG